ncbi:MAG: hypothetical protein BMS9Abin25_1339 [Gammaproteobacteria bacterium]|nr:MAG: hypothetical protein BMS9Abin25_1339 [Gammaproteobacteria bacterium]
MYATTVFVMLDGRYYTDRVIPMAVQQNRKTPSKRGMRRSHDSLSNPALTTDPVTGEIHRRHHITADGFYKGRKFVNTESE